MSKIRYRRNVDVLAMLREAGYSTYTIRKESILTEKALQKIRDDKLPSWHELEVLCDVLHCHPVDLLEYVQDDAET